MIKITSSFFLLLFFVAVTSTISNAKSDNIDIEVHRVMGWLESASPSSDAKKSLSNGDHRLWGVRGIVTYLPGIDKKDYKVVAKKYGYRIIEGTSDFLRSDEHKRFNDLAKTYAEKYNFYLQKHRDK